MRTNSPIQFQQRETDSQVRRKAGMPIPDNSGYTSRKNRITGKQQHLLESFLDFREEVIGCSRAGSAVPVLSEME